MMDRLVRPSRPALWEVVRAMSTRTVVVGYGRSGKQFHCYLIGLTPGLILHGVVARAAEARQRVVNEQQCKAYASLEEALDDADVGLIMLATPNSTHADLAVQALNAGKHVVTEKPMCVSLQDCDRMIAAAEKNGVMLNVFQNRRFDGDYLTLRKLMDDGELGEVKWVELAWQGFKTWGGWHGQAAWGGGRYWDLGAHLVDQLCMIFPQAVDSVYCRMHHDYAGIDVESEALLVVTFAGGTTGVCDFSSATAISKARFHVHGTKATFCKYGLDPQEDAMCAGDIDAAVEDPSTYGILHDGRTERTVPTIPGRWRDYYENIAAVLEGEAEPVAKLAHVRREIAVLDAGKRSAESGEVVKPDIAGLSG